MQVESKLFLMSVLKHLAWKLAVRLWQDHILGSGHLAPACHNLFTDASSAALLLGFCS